MGWLQIFSEENKTVRVGVENLQAENICDAGFLCKNSMVYAPNENGRW